MHEWSSPSTAVRYRLRNVTRQECRRLSPFMLFYLVFAFLLWKFWMKEGWYNAILKAVLTVVAGYAVMWGLARLLG